jgi:hypothetical protein
MKSSKEPRSDESGRHASDSGEHRATLDQRHQHAFVGKPEPIVRNLGHPGPESRLKENPAQFVDYTNNRVGEKLIDEPRTIEGAYRSTANPVSGIASAENIAKWRGYSTSNSFHGGTRNSVRRTKPI